jgi:hypothetical protein
MNAFRRLTAALLLPILLLDPAWASLKTTPPRSPAAVFASEALTSAAASFKWPRLSRAAVALPQLFRLVALRLHNRHYKLMRTLDAARIGHRPLLVIFPIAAFPVVLLTLVSGWHPSDDWLEAAHESFASLPSLLQFELVAAVTILGLLIWIMAAARTFYVLQEDLSKKTSIAFLRALPQRWAPEALSELVAKYDAGLEADRAALLSAPMFQLSGQSFQQKVAAAHGKIGGLGVQADPGREIQDELDLWSAWLANELKAYPHLASKVTPIPRSQRRILVKSLGYSKEFAGGIDAVTLGRASYRLREVSEYRREISGKAGTLTGFPSYGALSMELRFPAEDLLRIDNIQSSLAPVAAYRDPHYHVTFAWHESLDMEETVLLQKIIRTLQARIEEHYRDPLSVTGDRIKPPRFRLKRFDLRSFTGFFERSRSHGGYPLLSPEQFEKAVARGRKELASAFDLKSPLLLDEARYQRELETWLGLFQDLFLSDTVSLYAAIGMGAIPRKVLRKVAHAEARMRIELLAAGDHFHFIIRGEHRRPGIQRAVLYSLKRWKAELVSVGQKPQEKRQTPVEVDMEIKGVSSETAEAIARELRQIPDINVRELLPAKSRADTGPVVVGEYNERKVVRVAMRDESALIERLFYALFDRGDRRIRAQQVSMSRGRKGLLEVTLTLEVPSSVPLPALLSQIESATHGHARLSETSPAPPAIRNVPPSMRESA